jgi:hypothetical protein
LWQVGLLRGVKFIPETDRISSGAAGGGESEGTLITLNDLVGFTELTDADVRAIARHEHVTVLEAIRMGCRMMQSSGGQTAIIDFLKDDLQTASTHGDRQLISEIEASLARLERLNAVAGVPRRRWPNESPASAGRS